MCSEDDNCPAGQGCYDGHCLDGPPGDVDAAAPGADAPIGNIFTFTFDEPETNVINSFDRSGNSHTAWSGSLAFLGPGKFGMGREFVDDDPSSHLRVPYYEKIKPVVPLTIELWLKRDQLGVAQVLISDFSVATVGLVRVAIDANNQPTFQMRDGCDGDPKMVTATGVSIAALDWVHLAVVADVDSVEFFVDGLSTFSAPLTVSSCDQPSVSSLSIGSDRDRTSPFVGTLDDIKWSNRAKTAAEIQASMDFDSSSMGPECGDGLIEADEDCEPTAQCCTSSCGFESAIGCGDGTCADGLCSVVAARSNQDLLVLYSFTEGAGTTVNDSGPGTPLNLAIDALTNVVWAADGLRIDGQVRIASALSAAKVIDAASDSGSFTIEAWVTPTSVDGTGPVRVVTISESSLERNMTLGQQRTGWVSRIRTEISSANALPSAIGPSGDAAIGRLSHVVATYSPGRSRLYVDGRLRATFPLNGDLSGWDETYGLSVGNEFVNDRLWLGTLHHIAAFSRELSPEDVAAHFAFGIPNQSN